MVKEVIKKELNDLLPYTDIWEQIVPIQAFKVPWNMGKTKEKVGVALEDCLIIKDEFFISSLEYIQRLDELINRHSPLVDFTFRYKEDLSVERNLTKDSLPVPLYKTLNDILGLRFIIKVSRIELEAIVKSFVQTCPYGAEKCNVYDLERDGYQGLHVYVRPNNQTFPIEFQFWTRTDALLNQYLRDTIYTRYENIEILEYSSHLRSWLESVPSLPSGFSIVSYVDYLYEKAFQDDITTEGDNDV